MRLRITGNIETPHPMMNQSWMEYGGAKAGVVAAAAGSAAKRSRRQFHLSYLTGSAELHKDGLARLMAASALCEVAGLKGVLILILRRGFFLYVRMIPVGSALCIIHKMRRLYISQFFKNPI